MYSQTCWLSFHLVEVRLDVEIEAANCRPYKGDRESAVLTYFKDHEGSMMK